MLLLFHVFEYVIFRELCLFEMFESKCYYLMMKDDFHYGNRRFFDKLAPNVKYNMDSFLMDEMKLVKELQAGSEEAFKILVDEYKNMILNTCFHFTYNKEDAEDLAQEVFIEAFQSIKKFRGESKVSTWLYRISISKSLDLIRKRKRKKRFAILKNIADMMDKGEEIPADEIENPLHQLEKKERAEILHRSVASLSESQRIAITLSKYEQQSNKEIAKIMDTSVSAVESLLHRAKKKLEKSLSQYFENSNKLAQV